ncbi:MAG: DUF5667 domain-containing protein [Methanoregula sp.]|nr:DUF5667 domain-containing protein [Methanoregula sp.]
MEKYLFGSVLALLFALLCLTGAAAAQEDTSGTVLTDDVQPYNGPIGADSPLYGLKLALEDMDESFTANETERVDRQMEHARLRLSEVRRSLELNQSDSAEQALNNYWLKMNLTNATITRWNSNGTGLLHAQEQIVKHQFVLENLLAGHPNNTGLQRAYNNSLRLEERFGEKTMMKFNRTVDKNNQTIMKAIRLETKKMDHNGWPDTDVTVTATPDNRQKGPDKDKDSGKGSGNGNAVTTVTTPASSGTVPPQQGELDQGNGQSQGQDNQPDNRQNGNNNGNSDKGKGNSKNK